MNKKITAADCIQGALTERFSLKGFLASSPDKPGVMIVPAHSEIDPLRFVLSITPATPRGQALQIAFDLGSFLDRLFREGDQLIHEEQIVSKRTSGWMDPEFLLQRSEPEITADGGFQCTVAFNPGKLPLLQKAWNKTDPASARTIVLNSALFEVSGRSLS